MKKKILIYTDVPFFAGCENILENIVSYDMIAAEFDLVYCYRNSRRYTSDLKARSIKAALHPLFVLSNDTIYSFIRHRFGRGLAGRLAKLPFWALERSYLYFLINFFLLYRLVRSHAPEIVHINNGGYPGASSCRVMALAAKAAGAQRVFFTVNNIACRPSGAVDRLWDRAVNSCVDSFVTASRAASEKLASVRRMSVEKLRVISNSVLFDGKGLSPKPALRREFGVPKGTRIIGSVGLLTERKGYHVLVEAARRITADGWRIYIFGDGEDRKALEEMIARYGLGEKVFLPGYRGNVLDYLLDFDLFVLPSVRNEDLPNVINEAMLFGKPVIGTRVAGIPEQIEDGVTGYLVEPGEPAALSAALAKALALSATELDRMGEAGRKRYMDQFSYFKSMSKYHGLYRELA